MEVLKLILQTLSLVFIGLSLLYAGKQLKLLKKTHADNHDWNRRKAAQDAAMLRQKRFTTENIRLINEELDYLNSSDPIPLKTFKAKVKSEPNLKGACHNFLNYYEALARGVNQRIYDEEVTKEALKTVMTKAFNRFFPYIQHRRSTLNPEAWSNLENLVNKWSHEKSPPLRDKTEKGTERA